MQNEIIKNVQLSTKDCDDRGRLSTRGCFELFMEIANAHAEDGNLGLYSERMKGYYWLVTRTIVRFYDRPSMPEIVQLETRMDNIKGLRSTREYGLRRGGKLLVCGKTDFAIFNYSNGKLEDNWDFFPHDLETAKEPIIDAHFSRIKDEYPDEPFASYKVVSTDIDSGRHMNNVAYIRAFESLFTTKELREMDIKEFEIHYHKQAREGDILYFRKKEVEGKLCYKLSTEDKTIVNIIITI